MGNKQNEFFNLFLTSVWIQTKMIKNITLECRFVLHYIQGNLHISKCLDTARLWTILQLRWITFALLNGYCAVYKDSLFKCHKIPINTKCKSIWSPYTFRSLFNWGIFTGWKINGRLLSAWGITAAWTLKCMN